MADRLVAINTAQPQGEQLPVEVRTELAEVAGDLTATVEAAVLPAATAAANTVTPGIVATDLLGRNITWEDAGGGEWFMAAGGDPIGGPTPAPATAVSAIVGAGTAGKASLQAETDADARNVINAPGLASTKNVFTGKQEINGASYTNSFDTDMWIAGPIRSNPTLQSQGLWIQHRVMGDLGGKVHDAGAAELRLAGASNTGVGQNAFEASLVVTGGVNDMGNISALVANFHTSGTPTGNVDRVSLLDATQIPPLAAGFTIDMVCGLRLEQQLVGAENWTLYAPDGNSALGPIVPKNSTTIAVVARSRSNTVAGTPVLAVQNSAATTMFQVTSLGAGGMGPQVSGATWWVNNAIASGGTPAMRLQGHESQTASLLELRDSGGSAHIRATAARAASSPSGALRPNLVLAASALSTTATDGFLYLSSMAGVPTGVPSEFTGTVPVVVDSTNSKLMVYVGGSWKGVVLA